MAKTKQRPVPKTPNLPIEEPLAVVGEVEQTDAVFEPLPEAVENAEQVSVPAVEIKKPVYEEWEVKIKVGKCEKIKMLRSRVTISDEQAAILNTGMLKGANQIGLMYFK